MINLSTIETQFGKMPVGSLLSIQCALISPDFSVYCNAKLDINIPSPIAIYPQLPLATNSCKIATHLEGLSQEQLAYVSPLRITHHQVHDIEQKSKEQAKSPEWFSYRERRFIASLTNKVRFRTSRTERGLKSVAAEIVKGKWQW